MRGAALRLAAGLHRSLLGAYPQGFLERYGDELERVFAARAMDAVRERGRFGLLVFTVAAAVDVVRNGVAERWGGSPQLVRRASPGRRGMLDSVSRDVRVAVRGLRRTPGFAAIAVLTIALGIGANTAIFSVVSAVLLRPLPYDAPQELVLVWGEMTRRDVRYFPTSPPDLQDFRAMSTQLESIAGVFTFAQPLLTEDGTAVQLMTAGVTPNFFDVLGVDVVLGRTFNDEDGRFVAPDPGGAAPAVNAAVILDHAFWMERFGGDRSVIGRVLQVGGQAGEVVGVARPGLRLHWPAAAAMARDVDMYFAMRIDYANAPRNNVFLRLVARLAPGATASTAQVEMDRITADLRAQYPVKQSSGFEVDVIPMHEDLVRPVRPIVLALMGAVGFVLLVACANVANLLLVRAVGRERELAVRASVGGTRSDLVRQLLAESAVLGIVGALGGVLLAAVGVRAVLAVAPADLPRLDAVSIDGMVLAFTLLATLGAVAIFGILPAVRASRPHLMDVLREGGRNPALGAGRLLRNAVVVAEVALCLVLLVGAGLMARSFEALQERDPGWRADGLLAFDVSLPFGRYPEPARRAAFMDQVQERLRGIAGVERVSAAFPLPFDNTMMHGRWGTQDALTNPDLFRQADFLFVMPEFFETLETPLIEGRLLTHADALDSAAVAVVDERFARLAFAGASPVGRDVYVRINGPEPEPIRIVGVVRNQRRVSLIEDEREALYMSDRFAGNFGQLGWVIRGSAVDTRSTVDAVRAELRALDPEVPLSNVRMLRDDLDRAMAPTRFALVLIGAFAAIALVLAAVGLYGVLSFAVRQRTAEIGVRVAFGAPRGRIIVMIVRQGLALGIAGIVIGVVAALALTRLMTRLLVGVAPSDPATYVTIAALFLGVAALASSVPALRAATLDPIRALREE